MSYHLNHLVKKSGTYDFYNLCVFLFYKLQCLKMWNHRCPIFLLRGFLVYEKSAFNSLSAYKTRQQTAIYLTCNKLIGLSLHQYVVKCHFAPRWQLFRCIWTNYVAVPSVHVSRYHLLRSNTWCGFWKYNGVQDLFHRRRFTWLTEIKKSWNKNLRTCIFLVTVNNFMCQYFNAKYGFATFC